MRSIIIIICIISLISCKYDSAKNQNRSPQKSNHITDPPLYTLPVLRQQDSTDDNAYYDLRYYLVDHVPDTAVQRISRAAAIVVFPDSLQVDKLVKKYGEEDFSTIADDNSYYQSEAEIYLRKKPLLLITPHKRYVKLIGSHYSFLIDTKANRANGWFTLFFRPDSLPRIADVTDVEGAYRSYFARKHAN